MPVRLYERIAKMRKLAMLEIVCTLSLLAAILFLAMVFFSTGNIWIIMCLVLIASVCFATIVYIAKRNKDFAKQSDIYRISLEDIDLQFINSVFGGTEIAPNSYVSFVTIRGFTARLLIQYCEFFDKQKLSYQRSNANKAINKKYRIKPSDSIFDVKAKFRINMVVCNHSNSELLTWLLHDTNQLLSRNESIIQMAVVLDERVLLVPDLSGIPILNELNRYHAAIQLVSNRLPILNS